LFSNPRSRTLAVDPQFFNRGSQSLQHYDEYKKLIPNEEGLLKVANKGIALRHRLSMGTIVSGNDLKIRYQKGGYLGSIEEWFIAKLKPGDTFAFSGKILNLSHSKNGSHRKKIQSKTGKNTCMDGRTYEL